MKTHLPHPINHRQKNITKEEQTQRPQHNGHKDRNDLQNLRRRHPTRLHHKGLGETLYSRICHTDERESCKGRGTNADEHSGSSVGLGEAE